VGAEFAVDSHFRDSYVDLAGVETVVHEYSVSVRVDSASRTILTAKATPQVLPWLECPEAADSAGRLAGECIDDLRPLVRKEFVGVSTCTHLNDQLRALADTGPLMDLLSATLAHT
jgi:hypothetical protein